MTKVPSGDPQLTKKQHIVPAKSIKRFCEYNKKVWVKRRGNPTPFPANPDDGGLYAKRVWEQRSEAGHKETIEDPFQEIGDAIASGTLSNLDQDRSDCVSAMFALWVVRARMAENPLPDLSRKQLLGDIPQWVKIDEWTSEERDKLEAGFCVASNPDGSIPGRMQAWPIMRRQIAQICNSLRGVRWGILNADEGEFLLPDRFLRNPFIPLSPEILLAAAHENGKLSAEDVAKVNAIAKSDFREWIVARSPCHFD